MGDPYRPAASQISNFPFASRTSPQSAPLFHSTTDEFREEEEETEHDREIADFYALQKSRRHFDGSYLRNSSEFDLDGPNPNADEEQASFHGDRSTKGKGIRSSWRGGKASHEAPGFLVALEGAKAAVGQTEAYASRTSSGARDNLVDVGLEDTPETYLQYVRRSTSSEEGDDDPPSIQQFQIGRAHV